MLTQFFAKRGECTGMKMIDRLNEQLEEMKNGERKTICHIGIKLTREEVIEIKALLSSTSYQWQVEKGCSCSNAYSIVVFNH